MSAENQNQAAMATSFTRISNYSDDAVDLEIMWVKVWA